MKKLSKEELENRYRMSKRLFELGVSMDIMLEIAHLFRPLTRNESGKEGQRIAERLSKEINDLLKEPITEADLIRKARQKQKEILRDEGII